MVKRQLRRSEPCRRDYSQASRSRCAVCTKQDRPETCKQLGVTDQTYYRWRKEYGGMKVDLAKRLKVLEAENARLKRAVADLTVDKLILKEVAEGKF